MKKVSVLFLTFAAMLVLLCGCTHKSVTYKYVWQNSGISELCEIRDREALEIFPSSLEEYSVTNYCFNWELGDIGSASVEYHFSIRYDREGYDKEIERLKNYRTTDGKSLRYDEETFSLPAYAAVLGYNSTSAYILADEKDLTVHYIYLSLMQKDELTLDPKYLPKGYTGAGDVSGESYSIFRGV